VDVVLNSLTGAAIPAGLRLLHPGGTFLELGKAEIWTQAQVRAVRPDVRFAVIGLDQAILDQPARVGTMLREVVAGLNGGAGALPVRSYSFADVTGALRCLQAARHISKLALTRMLFRGDACYVITGGTGALGRHLAAWLVAGGARHLVLLSRHPVALEIPDATVRSVAVDVADRVALKQALGGLSLPVKGVFHLAAALHDATAAQLSREGLEAALAAKLLGAAALDEATAALPLDHFVLFGSLAGVVGSAGQANYAAANSALDALVRARRARGAPALLVDWGAWQGDGMARGLGGPALPPDVALAALDAAMSRDMTRVAVSAGAAPAPPVVAGLAKRLAEAIGTARLDVVTEAVDEIVARILGLGGIALERERPLTELGLDSLMAVELRNALSAAIGRTLPASLVFDHPTAEALCVFLAGELGLVAVPMPAAPPPLPIAGVDDSELDDDAALLLLERKLSHAGY
jgi:polyketide synthase 12/myxalamid-type polyketide synthase MxaB